MRKNQLRQHNICVPMNQCMCVSIIQHLVRVSSVQTMRIGICSIAATSLSIDVTGVLLSIRI